MIAGRKRSARSLWGGISRRGGHIGFGTALCLALGVSLTPAPVRAETVWSGATPSTSVWMPGAQGSQGLLVVGTDQGSPRTLYRVNLPANLPEVSSTKRRKRLFIAAVLPAVVAVNDKVAAERARLLTLRRKVDAGGGLSSRERSWLNRIAERYDTSADDWERLLRRVDVVPTSMALAQAAIESGWGTSRFAQQGNALFGMWTWNESEGLVPKGREKGRDHAVKAYDSIEDSVADYVRTLNTHAAYRDFRNARARLRASNQPLSGDRLARHLSSYAELGGEYVRLVRSVIRHNKLSTLDRVDLILPTKSALLD